jgi:hypothetical protein
VDRYIQAKPKLHPSLPLKIDAEGHIQPDNGNDDTENQIRIASTSASFTIG